MCFRRKAPSAILLSTEQLLDKYCNSLSNNLQFQRHNSAALHKQLKEIYPNIYNKFCQNATTQRFYPAWYIKSTAIHDKTRLNNSQKTLLPELFTLPLPKYFINENESSSDFACRAFVHSEFLCNEPKCENITTRNKSKNHENVKKSSNSSTSKIIAQTPSDKMNNENLDQRRTNESKEENLEISKIEEQVYTLPRCGLSGLFFSREEVVDNLQAAATEMCFVSPFWIRTSHPALRSGYLKVKEGSEAVCISLSCEVISLSKVAVINIEQLHSSIRPYFTSLYRNKEASNVLRKEASIKFDNSIPLGMNALSGFVTSNKFVQQLPWRGLWISREQAEKLHIPITKEELVANENSTTSNADNNLLIEKANNDHSKEHCEEVIKENINKCHELAPKIPKDITGEHNIDEITSELGELCEIDQWELYNAEQLITPGRLALRQCLPLEERTSLFQSF